jgi:hypothetical protein
LESKSKILSSSIPQTRQLSALPYGIESGRIDYR